MGEQEFFEQADRTQAAVQRHFLNGVASVLEQDRAEHADVPPLAETLEEIAALLQRFMNLPNPALAMLLAVWISGTYLFERFQYCGYIALRSATPRCGKSRLLKIMSKLMADTPPVTISPTAAVLFRSSRKTLILDEVDKLRNKDREAFGEVLAVLNAGFERDGIVERVDKTKEGFVVKSFPVYGPKALAGLESLADALSDRAFQVRMERTPHRVARLNGRRMRPTYDRIRGSLAGWAASYGEAAEAIYEQLADEVPTLVGFDDRFQDIAEPLIVIASLADTERPTGESILKRLKSGLDVAAGRREVSGREQELLGFLEVATEYLGDSAERFVSSEDLVAACQKREDLARVETAKGLANLVKQFDLYPRFNSGKTQSGYILTMEWVETWRTRYSTQEGQ